MRALEVLLILKSAKTILRNINIVLLIGQPSIFNKSLRNIVEENVKNLFLEFTQKTFLKCIKKVQRLGITTLEKTS